MIAESFIRNWLSFPIPLTKENVDEISALLSQTDQVTKECEVLIALLDELLADYRCIVRMLIEIMKYVSYNSCILAYG